MPSWNQIFFHDWTGDAATSLGAANSTTGAGAGGVLADVSGGVYQIVANAYTTLSMLTINAGGVSGNNLLYNPSVTNILQRITIRIPPQSNSVVNFFSPRLRFQAATQACFAPELNFYGSTTVGGGGYSIGPSGSILYNWGGFGSATATVDQWMDIDVYVLGDGSTTSTIYAAMYSVVTPASSLPASGTLLYGFNVTDVASVHGTAALMGEGCFALGGDPQSGQVLQIAKIWLFEGDTSETITPDPASIVQNVAGQVVTFTGVNVVEPWTNSTPWTTSAGSITGINAITGAESKNTFTAPNAVETITVSDGNASCTLNVTAPGPVIAGAASIQNFGPSPGGINVQTTAPTGGAAVIQPDLYVSTSAFFAPPSAGTLVASNVTPNTNINFVPPAGTPANQIYYFRFYYHDGATTALSNQVQTPVGYPPRIIVCAGTSITSQQGDNIGSAIEALCGPLDWTILNLGESGSAIADWQPGQPYFITLQEQISGSNATTLWWEQGTNDYQAGLVTATVYANFISLSRTFLSAIAAACPTLKEILLNCIPFDYSVAAGVAASTISAADGAIYLATLAQFQRYPYDLAGTYSQAVAKTGATGFYAITAADSTLINDTDFRHPTIPGGQTVEEEGYARAMYDQFINPQSSGGGGGIAPTTIF